MGPSTMGALKNNAEFIRRVYPLEHIISTGEHNTPEVARVVRRISGTTVSPSSSDITAVTNPSAGKYVLTLATSRFDANFIICQINPCGAGVASKPYLAGYKVVSATSIEVYIKQLSSALGYEPAGNTWSAGTSVDFDIAIHSSILSGGSSWPTALPSNSVVGDPLKPSRWDALVGNAADIHKSFDVEHDPATGAHTTRQISSYSGLWRYDGLSMSLVAGEASDISVSRSSAGIYAVTSAKTLTTQTHCFVGPDYARSNGGSSSEMYRMHVLQNSTTSWTVYTYAFDWTTSVWNRVDGDFWLAMHSG